MKTAEEIQALLESLGSTPDAVASSLRDRGVRGTRFRCRGCPLVEAIRREGGFQVGSVVVDTDIWFVDDGPRKQARRLPYACAAFVPAFDEGRYPELVS